MRPIVSQAVFAALALAVAGCRSQRPGEYGEVACNNHLDDDHDGLLDCRDPDCFGTATCKAHMDAAVVKSDMDAGRPQDAGSSPPEPMDAGDAAKALPDATAPADDDSGAAVELDAAAAKPPCDPVCKPDEQCIDHQCKPVAVQTPGRYTLQIESATVPRSSSLDTRCYDLVCDNVLSIPYSLCACAVDPYIRVILVRSGDETLVGQTSYVKGSDDPTYHDAPFPLQLMKGDVLRFEAWDHDDPSTTDELLFACKPDLTDVQQGVLSCSTLAGALYATAVQITASLQIAP